MVRRKNIIIIIMIIMVLLMGIGYAILQTQLKINGTANLTGSWNVAITNVTSTATGRAYNIKTPTYTATTMTFSVGVKEPGDKMTFKVTVKNSGNIGAILNTIDATASGSSVIKYAITGIQNKTRLAAGASITFTVTTEFDIGATTIPDELIKDLVIKLNYIQDDGQTLTPENPTIEGENTLVQKILSDNQIKSEAGLDFSKDSGTTNGLGLYSTSTNTEGNKKTYYFRGNVTNNYVRFAGMDWRIIRINEDGSVRLIKTTGTTNLAYNSTATDNAHVGYMYGGPQSSIVYGDADLNGRITLGDVDLIRLVIAGTETFTDEQFVAADVNLDGVLNDDDVTLIRDKLVGSGTSFPTATDSLRYEATHRNIFESTLKTKLDEWYQTNLASYSSYLADAGFCNDRSKSSGLGYAANATNYGGYSRLISSATPMFKCPNESRDLFTTNASSKGNRALKYPVGLITADEAIFAGAGTNASTHTHYLSQALTFTMTPISGGSSPKVFVLSGKPQTGVPITATPFGYTPVINLKSNAMVSSGSGTSSSPYVIKTS